MHGRSSLAYEFPAPDCAESRGIDPDTLPWPDDDDLTPATISYDRKQWIFNIWRSRVVVACEDREFANQLHQVATSPDDLITFEYLSLNSYCRDYAWCIVLDIDDPQRWYDLQNLSIPPNLVGRNVGPDMSRRGNTQAIWVLKHPVRRNETPRAWEYLRRIRHMLTDPDLVGGDGAFTHGMSRSPFCTGVGASYAWTALHDHRWELDELAEGLEREGFSVPRPGQPLPARRRVRPLKLASEPAGRAHAGSDGEHLNFWLRDHKDQIQRNDSLFNAARFYAYPRARSGNPASEAEILQVIEPMNACLDHLDPERKRLPMAELESIARSVAWYCATHDIAGSGSRGDRYFHRYTYWQRVQGGIARASQPSIRFARAKGNVKQRAQAILRAVNIQRLFHQGRTRYQIAADLSLGYWTVRKHLKRVISRSERLNAEWILSGFATVTDRLKSCPTDTATGERYNPVKHRLVLHTSPIDVPVYAIESAEESTSATRVRKRDQGRSRSAPRRLKSVS